MADTVEQVDAAIDALASQPKQVTADGTSIVEHSIQDLLALRDAKAAAQAATSSRAPFRMFKTKPPGAV